MSQYANTKYISIYIYILVHLDPVMPGNRCYFRVTFNIFLYIVLNPIL